MVWLAIDLGDARVGLAVSDPELTLAHPAGNIDARGDSFHALDEVIDKVIRERIEHVVIGLPLQLDGTDGKSAKKARRWAVNLQRRLTDSAGERGTDRISSTRPAVSVELIDERLTTVSAHRQLHDAALSSRQHRPMVDQQSAVLILQSALDRRHHEDMREGVNSA